MIRNAAESRGSIMPAGPLMKEHRLIERLIVVLRGRAATPAADSCADYLFVREAADFIRTYVDQCHHGKEENILFRELAGKKLSPEHAETIRQLVAEHEYGRKLLRDLIAANGPTVGDDKRRERAVVKCLKALIAFYPGHIEKEDKHFFLPCMEYFTRREKDDLLAAFEQFDRAMIHKKYCRVVELMEMNNSVKY